MPAEGVIHYFRVDRPGQSRGIPDITPALPLFAQLRRYTLAVLGAAETAADFAGILYTDAPPDGRGTLPSYKTPVIVIRIGDRREVYPLPWVAARADAEGRATVRLGSADVAFRYRPDPPTAAVEVSGSDAPAEIVHAFWFAWYAMHPGARLSIP